MSLINQMLQDLEARRADDAERAPLHREVRPLPPQREKPWLRIAIGTVLAGILTGTAILWLRAQKPEVQVQTAAPAPKPIPPAQTAPVVPAPPEAMTTLPTAPEATPANPPVSPRAAEAPATVPPLAPPQAQAPSPRPKPAPTRPVREAGLKVDTALSVPAPAPVAAAGGQIAHEAAPAASRPAPRAGEGAPSIEKTPRVPTARERAEAEYRRAVGLLNQGRLNDAIAALRAALHDDRGHANARLTLVGLLVEQKSLDEAQALLQEGLAPNAAQPPLAMRLARIQAERGELAGAAATLQQAAAVAGENAEYRGLYAAVLQRLDRHREAAEEYRAALRLNPQSGLWWMGLAISLEADGHAAQARKAFAQARATGALSPELAGFVDQKLRQLAP